MKRYGSAIPAPTPLPACEFQIYVIIVTLDKKHFAAT